KTYDAMLEALIGPNGDPDKPETYRGLLADGMKGLILDLRFNPGGRLDQAVSIVDLFVDKGVIVSTKGRNRPQDIKYAKAEGTLTVAYYYLPSGRLVHRKKDAADWGVQPQIVVAMDPAAEQRAMRERFESELFRRPVPKTSTRPTTTQAAAATTQPADAQLQSG